MSWHANFEHLRVNRPMKSAVSKASHLSLGLEWCRKIENIEAKTAIATTVAAIARQGEVIGAGSGSTSFLTVKALAERVNAEGLLVRVVPTSLEIAWACEALGLSILQSVLSEIDWCFDGADEVDARNWMIKGRGGALYRERQVFRAARRRIVVADASKTVQRLGSRFAVPIEIEPSWARFALSEIGNLDTVESAALRFAEKKDGPVVTEGGGVILDARFRNIDSGTLRAIEELPGFRCHGVFAGYEFERL
jgi:ribose 5-phosphate isomerase A